MLPVRAIILLALLGAGRAAAADVGPVLAYSLGCAADQLARGLRTPELMDLAGINIIGGVVYDDQRRDLILVGRHAPTIAPVTLDDLAVALRAMLKHRVAPVVSIDPTEESPRTGLQSVRFEGGIADTQYGRDLLEADILLKKISLGLTESGTPAAKSYVDVCVERLSEQEEAVERVIGSRFWFRVSGEAALVELTRVCAIRALPLEVHTEVVQVAAGGPGAEEPGHLRNEYGDSFAQALTDNLADLSARHPALARLRVLLSLAAVAQGIGHLAPQDDLRYWLDEYPVSRIRTPREYSFHRENRTYQSRAGASCCVEVCGGVRLDPIVRSLQAGELELLPNVVIDSRPATDALVWRVPIDAWEIRWAVGLTPPTADPSSREPASPGPPGCYLAARAGPAETIARTDPSFERAFVGSSLPPPVSPIRFTTHRFLPWHGTPGQIGGVMLCNTARVEGLDGTAVAGAAVDPVTGSFNLLLQGQDVPVRDAELRKFVTALWAVYFGQEDPGLSIDPIWEPAADGQAELSERQLVRLIGNIADTHLAKVLLDADYYMKRCAVGIEQPPIPGFQSVDDLTAHTGIHVRGASRRFWFVPEDMSFRLGGGALVFDGGRVTVKTTYADLDDQSEQREPADERFAQFWSDHYWEFAAVNPVYEELYEYARLTALAKYLKQSGASLQWFLMANRHLVLQAPIPGTVPTLRTRSRVLEGTQWSGGVKLAVDMSREQPGRYILDDAAARAMERALTRRIAGGAQPEPSGARRSVDYSTLAGKSFTARLPESSYTVVPVHGLTAGTGPGGVTYHTDLAARTNGEPGLELIRVNRPGRTDGGLGKCWDLYRPYDLEPADDRMVKLTDVPVLTAADQVGRADLYVPERMRVVDRLSDTQEVLTYDPSRYDTVAWVPAGSTGRLEALTCLSDGSFVLAEKSGCRFRFDPQGRLTHLLFSPDHSVCYSYDGHRIAAVTDAFGNRVELRSDDAGRVTRATLGASHVDYVYRGDELALVKYPDGRRVAMIYDADGALRETVCKLPTAAAHETDEFDAIATETPADNGRRPERAEDSAASARATLRRAVP